MVITFTITYTAGKYIVSNKTETAEQTAVIPDMTPQPVEILNLDETADEEAISRNELLDPFLDAIETMNKEGLPFDEPKTEYGQQDGFLRPKWQDAYFLKKSKFKFNGDTYYVFGRRSDNNSLYPKVPQVCSDYVIDSIERSLKNWFYASRRKPHRLKGKFSIREEAKKEGYNLRRIRDMIKYMKAHPEKFEFAFEGNGLEIGSSNLLNVWLTQAAGAKLGSVVVVSGKVPWGKEEHSHSFIITRMQDELIAGISGNAGIAREWALSVESRRSPRRTVRYVINLTDEFLKQMK